MLLELLNDFFSSIESKISIILKYDYLKSANQEHGDDYEPEDYSRRNLILCTAGNVLRGIQHKTSIEVEFEKNYGYSFLLSL
jgi:hypothetical protein